jgi:hypothetical protein
MTDGHPGWFKDPSEPTLARWHDGEDWTEHTLVIADQAPGVEPAPPVIEPSSADAYFPRHSFGSNGDDDGDRESGLPGWAKILIPVLVVAVGVLGFSFLAGGDDDDPETATVDTRAASLDEAVEAARDAGLPSAISDARAAALIQRICGAAERPADIPQLGADLGQLPVTSVSELRTSVSALGEGAEERCAEEMAEAEDLMDDLQDQAFVAFGTDTTVVTVPGDAVPGEETDGGATDEGGDDEGSGTTRTTVRGTTTTRPSTTTTAPTTTSTKNDIQVGFACPTEGATAVDKFGKNVTCSKGCSGSSKLTWRSGPCPTTPVPPTTPPGGGGGTTTSGG